MKLTCGSVLLLSLCGWAVATPATMRQVRTKTRRGCGAPFDCVEVATVDTPKPVQGEILVKINASSVNPSDVDTVEGGGCSKGCGADMAGTVVACPMCTSLKVGDQVWGLGGWLSGAGGVYADYAMTSEKSVGLKPPSLSFKEAATLPEVGLTSFLSLIRTAVAPGNPLPSGSPWDLSKYNNLTVVITAGSGGTGFTGIQLAKAWGAKHIATTASGEAGIAFVKSLGATFVVDYKKEDIFAALPDNSVDIVYDNYGKEGTADLAMRTIRPGGSYLLLPHGGCFSNKSQAYPCVAAHPKDNVTQLNYATSPDFLEHGLEGFNRLSQLVEAGQLRPDVDESFTLDKIADAFTYSAGPGAGGVGDHEGKISITV
eukprot:Hpha_TRINITY_DN15095_c0_g1::TRINITY_DN15095_c0_g1_i1::g.123016::m.123016